MSQGLQELSREELTAEMERLLLPQLAALLRTRAPGHCMRISDLDPDLMLRLCGRLRAEVPGVEIVILDDGRRGWPSEFTVTSTKLVELRNPLPDGQLRPPLLAFVPSDMRAAAEDSFGVATFEDVAVGDVYRKLKEQLLLELPVSVRGAVTEVLCDLEKRDDPWYFADPLAVVRFLLTAKVNGGDAEAIGAALYEVGLVPDFDLLQQPALALSRIGRNRECVEHLTWSSRSERGRVLELGLLDPEFRKDLGSFLAETGVEDPRAWMRRIVFDRTCWKLAFNQWEFEDGGMSPDGVYIGGVTTNLPAMQEGQAPEGLDHLVGQQVLAVGSQRSFSASFRVDPAPAKVQGLAKFVVQVVSKEQGPVGLVRSKAVWKAGSLEASVSFTNLGKVAWEAGWHLVRVLPYTEDGDLIPILDENGNPLPWSAAEGNTAAPRRNESDLFYVLPEGEVEVTPEQRAVQREASVTHAQLRLQFTALQDGRDPDAIRPVWVGWAEKKERGRSAGMEMLEVKFSRDGTMHVPVSRSLRLLEQKLLADPYGHISWRISITAGVAGEAVGNAGTWPVGPATDRFLAARAEYCAALRAGGSELVTQGANLSTLRPLAVTYAGAYLHLVEELRQRAEATTGAHVQEALAELRRVLALDSVTLALVDHRGQRREAGLVAPTHPLRALWLTAWAELGQRWLPGAKDGPREGIGPARDALLKHLAPVGFPPVLVTGLGRVLTPVDNIHPFWTLYAPSQEENPRGLVGEVCAALGLPEPAIGGALIDGKYLAARVKRYLVQHPYVRTLVINAFNAGRGTVLADLLLELQREDAFADVRYDLRLFVPDPDAPAVGEALIDLLSPAGSVTAREAAAFTTPTESHLWPKLRLAIRPTGEFHSAPEAHPGHLTMLFDVFQAGEVGAAPASARESVAPVHGLIQDYHVSFQEDDTVVAWKRQPRHGPAVPIPGAEELSSLLAALGKTLSVGAAAVATGQAGADLRPVVTLVLGPEDRVLLHQVHEVSDWVITIDRHMGSEFFDHGGRTGRPDYLIDHSPDMAGSLGHRLVITSRSVAELEALLRPVLKEYELPAEPSHVLTVLNQLRSLSGRLALKLISSPTQRAEALGLALARLYLEHQGVFANQVVIPLDSHLDLYRSLRRNADELGDDVSFKRTDLALFDLDPRRRVITCRLVEVKCFSQVGDVGAYQQLQTRIAEQIAQSEQVLALHFDPNRSSTDRVDRLMKSRELVQLLEFYLERSVRYGVMTQEAEQEARFFLRTLEGGYRMDFTRSALIFDFAKPGTEPAQVEAGVEYHRVGADLVRSLVEAAADTELLPVEEAIPEAELEAVAMPEPEQEAEVVPEANVLPTSQAVSDSTVTLPRKLAKVPTLDTAAFLGERRDRTVEWDQLHAKIRSRPAEGDEHKQPQATPEDRPPSPSQQEPDTSMVSEPEPARAQGESEVAAPSDGPAYDVLLGVSGASPQYGLLGEVVGRRVALDLNQTHTISLFGVQGGGKSYTLGTVVEMASLQVPKINHLPKPLATVIFHYSPTMDYKPEFTSMIAPNSEEAQIRALRETYGAEPRALTDVILLVPGDKIEERRAEYPGVAVHPLTFAAAELQASHWRFLIGAVGNQATYIRQLNRIMKSLRNDMTLAGIRAAIEASDLGDHLKSMARMRLELAAEYIDDTVQLSSLIRPGRLIIVDLRDEFIEKDEALGLFVVLLQLFAEAKHEGQSFNKLVVFDEAHKYIESPDLVAGLVEVVREMRHKGTSIMVASQDPPSVPVSLIELSTQVILHKFNSPAWLKHIQKANAALGTLTAERMANLRPGEAYVWSSKASDDAFTHGAVRIRCRPRVTQHGGDTKTAVQQ